MPSTGGEVEATVDGVTRGRGAGDDAIHRGRPADREDDATAHAQPATHGADETTARDPEVTRPDDERARPDRTAEHHIPPTVATARGAVVVGGTRRQSENAQLVVNALTLVTLRRRESDQCRESDRTRQRSL